MSVVFSVAGGTRRDDPRDNMIRGIDRFAWPFSTASRPTAMMVVSAVAVKDNIHPNYLETSETLLISCDRVLLSTEDGESFMDEAAEVIEASRRQAQG